MKRTAILPFLLVALTACGDLSKGGSGTDDSADNATPTVTLTAAPPAGPAPLAVTFTANADDNDGDDLTYSWSLAGAENGATASQTFAEAGSYPVTITVSDGQASASASTTVVVTAGEQPAPGPQPGPNPGPRGDPLSVTSSPDGPIPWGVTYAVTADDAPSDSTLTVTCNGQGAVDLADVIGPSADDVFSCVHTATGEAVVATLTSASGEVLAREELTASVQPASGVPFGGAWGYAGVFGDSFYEDASFSITRATDDATGQGEGQYSEDGLFDPVAETFTLSASLNRLTLESPSLSAEFVFIGSYAGRDRTGDEVTGKQVFVGATASDDLYDDYLYTTD